MQEILDTDAPIRLGGHGRNSARVSPLPAQPDYAALLLFFRPAALIRSDSNSLAFCKAAFRDALKFLPARFTKNVSILIPEPGPFGDTFFEASVRAIVSGSLVKSPSGGNVESVFTFPDHFFAAVDMDIDFPKRKQSHRLAGACCGRQPAPAISLVQRLRPKL
jgi:hypothetical protein